MIIKIICQLEFCRPERLSVSHNTAVDFKAEYTMHIPLCHPQKKLTVRMKGMCMAL